MKMMNYILKNMKNMNQNKTIVGLVLIVILGPLTSWAYIPSADFIFTKITAQTGRKIFSIDQEVTIKIGDEETKIDETWLVEGDRNLKLTAKGQGLYKDAIKINAVYNNDVKTILKNKVKSTETVSVDFYQRLLFSRANESIKKHMTQMGISSDVKLSRADGYVAYLFGTPSSSVEQLQPQLWIGQDDFLIRKVRTLSGTDIAFSDFSRFNPQLILAKKHQFNWGKVKVSIVIKKINFSDKYTIADFYPQTLNQNTELHFVNKSDLTEAIEVFYSRFR